MATVAATGEAVFANDAWTAVFGGDGLWARLSEDDRRFAADYAAEAATGSLVAHQVFLVEREERAEPLPVLLHFLPVRLPESGGRCPVLVAGEVLQEPATWAAEQTRRRRMEMLGQMAMGIAHDFNNLLTAILGHAELLRTTLSSLPEEAQQQLRTLERAAGDGAALVRKIQQFIRHDRQERFEPVDAAALIDEVVTLTRPYWYNEPRRQGITLHLDTDLRPVPLIQGAPTELREVLVNLILNAVQAMPAGGTLTLRTRPDPVRGCIVEVQDTGMGMTETIRARIFEPLFTTKGERGTGMGLAVSHGIVQEHGGVIEVESRPGRGSLFRLVFPPAAPAREAAPAPDAPATKRRPARILVVDDEPMVRSVTARLLRLKGHTVEEADRGSEALIRLATDDAFDLLVTDLSMPGMSGRELAVLVRDRHPHLPILLVTGDTDAEAGTAEVDGVVKKPFKLDTLEEAIQQLIGRDR